MKPYNQRSIARSVAMLVKFGLSCLILALPTAIKAQDKAVSDSLDLYSMSLEELMNMQVSTGTLVGTSQIKVPTSVTTINREQIEMSSARNLMDLLEIYVPGVQYMWSSEGMQPGMRGIINDRNYKMLLLVNGVNLNQKGHAGAVLEFPNWDLGDIDHIEIIRGPGSVTYGPGAIGGVVNIVTVDPSNTENSSVHARYDHVYGAKTAGFTLRATSGKTSMIFYGSMAHALGSENDLFKAYDAKITKIGTSTNSTSFTEASDLRYGFITDKDRFLPNTENPGNAYMAVRGNMPQIKAMTVVEAPWGIKGMVKFNNTGSYTPYQQQDAPQVSYATTIDARNNILTVEPTLGSLESKGGIAMKSLAGMISKETAFGEKLKVNARVTYSNQEYARYEGGYLSITPKKWIALKDTMQKPVLDEKKRQMYDSTKLQPLTNKEFTQLLRYADAEDAYYKLHYFSEQTVLGGLTATFKTTKLQVAAGAEISRTDWGKPWGEGYNNYVIGEGYYRIMNSFTSSDFAYRYDKDKVEDKEGFYIENNGWHSLLVSGMTEANYDFNDHLSVMASARLDKDTYSDVLVSPRLALIGSINEHNVVKLIAQQSNRMNTAESMLVKDAMGIDPEHEKLSGIELIYTRMQGEHLMINANAFYNKLEVMTWNGFAKGTTLVGKLDIAGAEAEVVWNSDKLKVGLNHAFTKQIDHGLIDEETQNFYQTTAFLDKKGALNLATASSAPVITKRGDTTFTEVIKTSYYLPIDLKGTGSDLSNWSNHATKIFASYSPIKNLTVFASARLFWTYEGMDNLADAYSKMADNMVVNAKVDKETTTRIAPKGATATTSKKTEFVSDGPDDRPEVVPYPERVNVVEQYQEGVKKARDIMEEYGIYSANYSLDASISYKLTPSLKLLVYGSNLLSSYKRYQYDQSVKNQIAESDNIASFIKEPLAYGAKLFYNF